MFKLNGSNIIIAGPCALDSDSINLKIAGQVLESCLVNKFEYVFKASFDKANRLSLSSPRGRGLESSIAGFKIIKDELKIPITTDVHEVSQVNKLFNTIDIFQIPALLSRQTDLIIECARTKKVVNIKKGQFMSWEDAVRAADKANENGASDVLITERGTTFGYRDLIVDFRNIHELLRSEYKFVYDATHSVQRPGGKNSTSTGDRKYITSLAYAAAAAGTKNFFFETHPNPTESISDGDNLLPLSNVPTFLDSISGLMEVSNKVNYFD
jgi:2-dehydro-3-deoxyphosphooctonate aldolase (KDO 8-P synthase)